MASSAAFTVGTTPVQIASGLKHVVVRHNGPSSDGAGWTVYLGGSGVTSANGLPVDQTGGPFELPIGLTALESLYAVLDAGVGTDTVDVRVLTYLG